MSEDDVLKIGGLNLNSRVIIGSALYTSPQVMLDAIRMSGTQLVTVSLRRAPVNTGKSENVYNLLSKENIHILPNTAGCYTAKEAIFTAELAREALETNLIKLEVIADDETLLPDSEELLIAAESLVSLGFQVLPYTNDDPVLAKKLEDVGCAAVMPLAAPIGTGLGIRNPHNIELIVSRATIPVIIDAGLGTASHVCQAFELGCSAVLLNTAIARAKDPVKMVIAVKDAASAGRYAFCAGRMPPKDYAEPSSPVEGIAWS